MGAAHVEMSQKSNYIDQFMQLCVYSSLWPRLCTTKFSSIVRKIRAANAQFVEMRETSKHANTPRGKTEDEFKP